MSKSSGALFALVLSASVLAVPLAASARDHDGGYRDHRRGGSYLGPALLGGLFGLGIGSVLAPRYGYAPEFPQGYYAAPPVVYAPPPVYYRQPVYAVPFYAPPVYYHPGYYAYP